MRTVVDDGTGTARQAGMLTTIQLLLVTAYGYAAVAYLTTDAEYFPEQAPPGWAWPAVAVVGTGFIPAVICLALALPGLRSPGLRAHRSRWVWLTTATAASGLMLLVMATPPGWTLFDWYVA